MRLIGGIMMFGFVVAVVDPTLTGAAIVGVLAALTLTAVTIIKAFSEASARREVAVQAALDAANAAQERKEDREAAKEAARILLEKQEALLRQGEVIKGSVDGHATKQDMKLEAALKELEFMKRMVSHEEQKAERLASTTAAAPAAVIAPVSSLSTEILSSVDNHVEAIEENTERTDETVQKLKDR